MIEKFLIDSENIITLLIILFEKYYLKKIKKFKNSNYLKAIRIFVSFWIYSQFDFFKFDIFVNLINVWNSLNQILATFFLLLHQNLILHFLLFLLLLFLLSFSFFLSFLLFSKLYKLPFFFHLTLSTRQIITIIIRIIIIFGDLLTIKLCFFDILNNNIWLISHFRMNKK